MITREASLVKKYNGRWESYQILENIAPKSTLIKTYTPPLTFVFIPIYFVTGDQTYYWLQLDLQLDGTYIFKNIKSTSALEHILDIVWQPCYGNMTITITNTDITSTRTADILIYGILIPKDQYDNFIQEIQTPSVRILT